MSNRKTTFFYAVLIAVASLAVGMVIASRLGMSPVSTAQTVAPPMNSAPITGPLDRDNVPRHRQERVARGGQHPDRVAPARPGPV